MIITYFTSDKRCNLKHILCLIVIFSTFTQLAHAQCATPVLGCPRTDLSNFGSDSNNDFTTIEYDNFVSSFHSTIVRTSNGSLQAWGEKIANNGTTDILAPLTINAANFPALTGIPLKAALGSNSTGNIQGIILATDGLYAWSKEGVVISSAITSGTAFQKLTINGNSNGLPTGVGPQDVKMMFATYKTLAITTCSGEVWVLSQTPTVRGNGGTGNALTWYRVTTTATGNPFLTDIVVCRGNMDGLMALKSDGTVYVWGNNVLLGNNSAVIPRQARAVQMTLPDNKTPKMISSTGNVTARSYYILATDGNLYGLGENSNSELGDWTATDRLSWVQPRYTSATGPVMNDIKWFSAQEHDSQYGAINVINNSKTIYAFGNNGLLLGSPGGNSNPAIPNGLNSRDQILAVETGGHTSMIVKNCEAKFGYVGHRYNGSMGDGTNTDTNEINYTFATATVQICGVESLPIIQPFTSGAGPGMKYCVGDPVLLDPTPAGGRLTIRSGPGNLTGNTLNFTAEGTVVVQYLVTTACGGTTLVSKSFDTAICPLDLEVIKTVDNLNPSTGSTSVFTITAKNNGPYKATRVTVNDMLPSGYTFVSASPSTGTWSSPNWNIGNLSNQGTGTLTIVATVNASGEYANTATITGNEPDTNSANNTSTATPSIQSNLAVTKTISNATPNFGDSITFTITASNAGPSAATGVSVTDVLPTGYTFISATPSTGTWSSSNWFIGDLANGARVTLTIVATVNATGSYNNTASISGKENDPNLADNLSSVNANINHAPVAIDDIYTVAEDTTLILNLLNLDSDSDGDKLTVTSINGVILSGTTQVIPVPNGTVNISASGIITFTPDPDFNSITAIIIPYVISDGKGGNATAKQIITVTPVNENPVAVDDVNAAILSTSGPTAINKLTATDVDGTIAGYIIVSLPAYGTLALSGVPLTVNQVLTPAEATMLTYDPVGTFTGNDSFAFTATDNEDDIDASPAIITLVITKALLEAVQDPLTLADGINGSLQVINVLDNDKINGNPVNAADLILKGIGVPAGIILNSDGTIDVAPGTQAGNHVFTYEICEIANLSNCATATVRVYVEIPAIALVKTVALNDSNGNGYAEPGETLTYNFEITNTGNAGLENIMVTDPLTGIVLNGGPINLSAGQSDTSSITGTYTLTQQDLNAGTISNQATVEGITKSGIAVTDKSDFSAINGDNPTVLELGDCLIKIFNAVSANGDEKNSRFFIQGLECYPENTVQIYDRSGILVFERDHYNNNDIAFRGLKDEPGTIKDSNGLPEGTYFYIVRFKDKRSNPHKMAGYLYLTK